MNWFPSYSCLECASPLPTSFPHLREQKLLELLFSDGTLSSLPFLPIVKVLGVESIYSPHPPKKQWQWKNLPSALFRNYHKENESTEGFRRLSSRQSPFGLQREKKIAYCLGLTDFLPALFMSIHPFRIKTVQDLVVRWSGTEWSVSRPLSAAAPGNILWTHLPGPPPRDPNSVGCRQVQKSVFFESSCGVLIISHTEEPQRISASWICKCLRD